MRPIDELSEIINQINIRLMDKGGKPHAPAPATQVAKVTEWIRSQTKKTDWLAEYECFLGLSDGLVLDDVVFYNTDPNDPLNHIVHANRIWQEEDWDGVYLFLGDSEKAWYAYDIKQDRFAELEKLYGDQKMHFSSFTAMLRNAVG
ncbi:MULTISPECIES: YrhA family protein [Bhargavaea]|uniref:YrhA family protein n=1 Tax=Bhargavaea changchunensis TaxID=2134037 RepID=A0ABW2NDU7_9BACL|nr:YrhA family protein [Bhargavaea sp. CC-171006]